jgi:hypothetical protein
MRPGVICKENCHKKFTFRFYWWKRDIDCASASKHISVPVSKDITGTHEQALLSSEEKRSIVYVRKFDDSRVLHVTLLFATCYVLHRHNSQVIHRKVWLKYLSIHILKWSLRRFTYEDLVTTSRSYKAGRSVDFNPVIQPSSPSNSRFSSVGTSDGRCVQKAGTKPIRLDESCLLGIPRSWGSSKPQSQSYYSL